MTNEAIKLLFKTVRRFRNQMNLLDLKMYHQILFKRVEENEDFFLDKNQRETDVWVNSFKPEFLKYMLVYCE